MDLIPKPHIISWDPAGRVTNGVYFPTHRDGHDVRKTVYIYRVGERDGEHYIASDSNFASREYPDLDTAIAATILRLSTCA